MASTVFEGCRPIGVHERDVTQLNNTGTTNLRTAISEENLESVKFVVEKGANIARANVHGWTAPALALKGLPRAYRESNKGSAVVMDNGKYVRCTFKHVEALEQLYHEYPKTSSVRRQQLIHECHILTHVVPKHIKASFQNRREKKSKEASWPQVVYRMISTMNKLFMEERRMTGCKHKSQLVYMVYENSYSPA